MTERAIFALLGKWSDDLTSRILRRHNSGLPRLDLSAHSLAKLRRSQLTMIGKIGANLMPTHLANVLLLVVLDEALGAFHPLTLVWAGALTAMTLYFYVRDRARAARAPVDASRSDVGLALVQVAIIALLWTYPAAHMLDHAAPAQVGLVIAVMACVIAGGALSLHPLPMAVIGFTVIIVVGVLVSILPLLGSMWPLMLLGSVTFMIVLLKSTNRYASLFITNHLRQIETNAQRDMIALLMGDYQDASRAWLIRCDPDLLITDLSPGLLRALGLGTEGAIGQPLHKVLNRTWPFPISLSDDAQYRALAGPADALPLQCNMTLQISIGNEGTRIFTLLLRKTFDEQGLPSGFDGFARDVTEEYRNREKAQYLATHDQMTGLLNITGFRTEAHVRMQLFNGRRSDKVALFLFLDADNLKSVNDTCGHHAGDQLICAIGDRLSAAVGIRGVVTRKSGDEFLAILFDIDSAEVEETTAKVHAAICQDFETEGTMRELSASIGAATAPAGSADLWVLQQEADRALHYAKGAGRAQIVHYTTALGEALVYERQLAASLPAAIRDDTLGVEYQPILDLTDGTIFACEALVRWDHPTLGPVSPERLLQAARATSAGRDVALLVLRRALGAARDWPQRVMVTVNLPAQELTEGDCYDRISCALDEAEIDAQRLCIEITESELLENSAQVHSNLHRLRTAGVKIFIDDFGAGYSSLNYLPQYPTDAIKVDRSLMVNSAKSKAGPLILGAVATMARALHVPAVAEGVETEAELNIAREAGFQYVQGFYFHKPMRQQDLLALLASGPGQIPLDCVASA